MIFIDKNVKHIKTPTNTKKHKAQPIPIIITTTKQNKKYCTNKTNEKKNIKINQLYTLTSKQQNKKSTKYNKYLLYL